MQTAASDNATRLAWASSFSIAGERVTMPSRQDCAPPPVFAAGEFSAERIAVFMRL